MTVNGIAVNPTKLISKQELLDFLDKNGAHDRALSDIRERYQTDVGNELMWRYPISDGKHAGTFIIAIKEGFISLPYDEMDREDYELLELDDAAMFDEESLKYFIDDWKLFSDDLLSAMNDMLGIIINKSGGKK